MLYFSHQMRSGVICALMCLFQVVSAKIEFMNSVFNPAAGADFEITWLGAIGPVTIELIHGPSTNIKKDQVIASGLDPGIEGQGSSWVWEVPEDLVARGDYALYITDGTTENWSLQFALTGTGTALTGSPSETIPISTTVTTTTTRMASTSSEEPSESESSPGTTTGQQTSTVTTSGTETTSSAGAGNDNASGTEGGANVGSEEGGGQSADDSGNKSTTIGIAVGVSLGVVGLLALFGGYWFYRKSQRNRAIGPDGEAGSGAGAAAYPSRAELGDGAGGESKAPFDSKTQDELDGNPVAEIHSPDSRHEMYGGHDKWPAELSAERVEPLKGSR